VPDIRLLGFHVVDEAGDLSLDASIDQFTNLSEACGLFEFTKGA
jgi:hypothetical protein